MAELSDDVSDATLWKLTTSDDKQERAEALLELAKRKQDKDQLVESLSEAATARELFAELAMPGSEARAGWLEARALHAQDNCAEVIAVLERTIELYRSYAGEVELADTIRLQAQAFVCLNRCDEAEQSYRAAIELYRSNGGYTAAGICALDLGDLQGSNNHQTDALVTLQESLAIFQEGSDLIGSGRSHDRIAAALIDLGNIAEATEHLREGLRIFEYIEDAGRWTWAQYRLGWALVSQGQKTEAIPLLKEAARWYKEQGYYARAADADTQLAHALTNEGSEAEARDIYRRTRAVYSGLGLEHNARLADGNIAASLVRTKEHDAAIVIYRKILEQAHANDDQYLVRAISVRLANALRGLNTFAAFEEALTILDASPVDGWGDSISDRVFQLDSYRALLSEMGRDAEAEDYANRILSFGVEPGFMSYTANAYRALGLIEHDRGNIEESKALIAQAIALYLADGSDDSARELSKRLMPTGSAQGTDVLRPESNTTEGAGSSNQHEPDFGDN
jgi:tetratricopeptide (TPR) repeat protein